MTLVVTDDGRKKVKRHGVEVTRDFAQYCQLNADIDSLAHNTHRPNYATEVRMLREQVGMACADPFHFFPKHYKTLLNVSKERAMQLERTLEART